MSFALRQLETNGFGHALISVRQRVRPGLYFGTKFWLILCSTSATWQSITVPAPWPGLTIRGSRWVKPITVEDSVGGYALPGPHQGAIVSEVAASVSRLSRPPDGTSNTTEAAVVDKREEEDEYAGHGHRGHAH